MNNLKKNWVFFFIAIVSIGLGTLAVLTSLKLRQSTPVAPTVPQSEPQAAITEEPQIVTQGIWIDGKGYVREVPILANGTPQWNCDSQGNCPWGGPLLLGGLGIPGVTDNSVMQAQGHVVYPNGQTLMQGIWVDGKGYNRAVPMSNGIPQWNCDSQGNCPWGGPLLLGGLGIPGVTDNSVMQAQDEILYPNEQTVMQGIWVDGKGYTRAIPINNGIPQWNCGASCPWGGPLLLGGLGIPGVTDTSTMQSLNSVVYPNEQTLIQGIWVDGKGYTRDVPIVNGVPNWNCASQGTCPWGGPLLLGESGIPGVTDASTMQSSDSILVSASLNNQCTLAFTLTPGVSPSPTPGTSPSPTPGPSVSPSPTPSTTPGTSPSPTPSPVAQCNSVCDNNDDCPTNMVCYITSGNTTGVCRIPACQTDSDCNCDQAFSPVSPTPTPSVIPSVPQAGTAWPTFFVILGGAALLILTFALL